MKPITREEQYLNRLAGETEQTIPSKPDLRKEQYLSRLCGGDNLIPEEPINREEQYLANLCGEEVDVPKPITRLEQYMAFAAGESEDKPEKPITREEWYWDNYQGGAVPEEKTVSGTLIHVTDAVEEPATKLAVTMEPKQEATPFVGETTTEPYLSKTATTTGNKRYLDKIVGGTVCWNQLVDISTNAFSKSSQIDVTINENDEFLLRSNTNSSAGKGMWIDLNVNNVYLIICESKTLNSDYHIVTGFKDTTSSFNNDAFMPSKRIFVTDTNYKKVTILAKATSTYKRFAISVRNSTPSGSGGNAKNIMLINITTLFSNAPSIADYINDLETATAGAGVQWLKDHGFIDDTYRAYNAGELISTRPEGIQYGNTTATFGSPVELRGLYKLDANNKLYCDGDELTPDGTLKTNYDYRAYQSGDEELTDAITDGTNTVVKKVTPTTSASETYPNPVDIENGDTEAFTDTRAVPIPVGNESHYAGEYEIEGYEGVTVYHAQTQDEPNPTEYEVEFTSQGTVYGGTIDLVSGELVVDRIKIDLGKYNGNIINTRPGTPETYFRFEDVNPYPVAGSIEANIISDKFKTEIITLSTTNVGIGIVSPSQLGHTCIAIRPTNAERYTVSTFKPYIKSIGGVVVVYRITPQIYTLTPQQIDMLLGENYFWAENGENIELTYKARAAQRVLAMNNKLSLNKQALEIKRNGGGIIDKPIIKPIDKGGVKI